MKKLSIILAVVVLAAAIGIGVLVNQKGGITADLNKANKQIAEVQGKLDEATKKAEELQGEVDAAKTELETKQEELIAANNEREAAAGKSADLLKMVDETTTAKNKLSADLTTLQNAKDEADAKVAELEAKLAELEGELTNRDQAKDEAQATLEQLTEEKGTLSEEMQTALNANAELEASLTAEQAKVTELETAKAEAEAALTEALEKSAEMEARITELETEVEAAQAKIAALETRKSDLEKRAAALITEKHAALAELTALKSPAAEEAQEEDAAEETAEPAADAQEETPAVYKFGQGMVTSIGSVAEATEEKAGAAQVNTTVCSLLLDGEGKILSVVWDVQQSKIQFDHEGKPINLPEELLTKLEKGEAYGMVKVSEIGKEWFEQIAAFAEYATGKTVDEVLNIPVYERDANHKQVPDVEELKASVTITVGDYLASLKKAAENAK
ncbi:MAG: hypothetical protein ACOYI6_05660 [Christensenellales bacterium]|jgi:predicted  nucleic acid-binding Zn-ribbon protein|nr:hypothetical protein [Clostridiales bacterium]